MADRLRARWVWSALAVLFAVACTTAPVEETGTETDTDVPPLLCAQDERVQDGACVPCEPGTTNEAGDDARDVNTECDPTFCAANEYVFDHTCTACPQGQSREAGDDASGDDTACIPCMPGTFDPGDYTCQDCAPGSTSEAGATECLPCPTDTFEEDNACIDCPEDFTSEEGATVCLVASVPGGLSERDYGFLFWPGNHWTKWRTYNEVQHVQTGYYGLAINVTTGSLSHFGMMDSVVGPDVAQESANAGIEALAEAQITYSVDADRNSAKATQFLDRNGAASNPSEMIDMGRFMQQIEVPTVRYADNNTLTGRVKLAAMPRHFVLTQAVTSTASSTRSVVRIEIEGAALSALPNVAWLDEDRGVTVTDADSDGWSFIIADQGATVSNILPTTDGGLIFESEFDDVSAGEELALSVIAVPTNTGGDDQRDVWLNPGETAGVSFIQMDRDGTDLGPLNAATWDPERGCCRPTG